MAMIEETLSKMSQLVNKQMS
jgi:hypothetical protein